MTISLEVFGGEFISVALSRHAMHGVRLLCVTLALVVRTCRCNTFLSEDAQLQQKRDLLTAAEGVYGIGVQYFISRGELFALQITTSNSSLTRLTPVNRGRGSASDSNPFLLPDDGSGLGNTTTDFYEEPSNTHQYTYTVYHHHAYIVVDQDIIVLLLNKNTPNYHRIQIGHTPLQVEATAFNGETYLFVLYETNSRGYVATYRKHSSGNWGKQGQYDVLVYSPEWFNISQMSNIIFFRADDWHYSYKVTYIAVAVGHTIYFKEILDSFEFSIALPEPCNRILSINFNEVKQTLFVVCTNITYYFSYLKYQLYTSGLWNRTGLASFSQDGRIAAIATNHSGGMTTVTIHGLNFEPSLDRDERVYEFQHFHHMASRSLIIRGEFVTALSTLHYYCYIELGEFGIVCINVERALMNVRNEGILDDATLILPNTHAVLCGSTRDCPVMYSHKELLVVQAHVCEPDTDCVRVAMLFNMTSRENIANLTDVSLDMLVYKAEPQPILISPPQNTSTHNSNGVRLPKTISAFSTSTSIIRPLQTPIIPQQTPTESTLPLPTTKSGVVSIEIAELLETCQNDLIATNTAYSQLLTVTITLCVCFCIAMVITILILVVLMYVSKRENKSKG